MDGRMDRWLIQIVDSPSGSFIDWNLFHFHIVEMGSGISYTCTTLFVPSLYQARGIKTQSTKFTSSASDISMFLSSHSKNSSSSLDVSRWAIFAGISSDLFSESVFDSLDSLWLELLHFPFCSRALLRSSTSQSVFFSFEDVFFVRWLTTRVYTVTLRRLVTVCFPV